MIHPSAFSQTCAAGRQDWIDAIKGLAIVLVVFGHALRGTQSAGLMAQGGTELFHALDARIYAFHMPLFFVVSGFFVCDAMQRSTPAQFIRTRLSRLIGPLVLWTYIFILAKMLAGSAANDPLHLSWQTLIPFPGQWQFWFLWALFVLHLCLVALRPLLLSQRWVRISLWSLLGLSLWCQTLNLPFSLNYWTSNALRFAPFLIVGMLLSQYGLLRAGSARAGRIGICVALALIVLVPLIPQDRLGMTGIAICICLGLLAGMGWIVGRWPGAATRWLVLCGQASMGIYLSHTLFMVPARVALMKLDVTSALLHVCVGTAIGVLAPMVLGAAVRQMRASGLAPVSEPKAAFGSIR